MSLLEVQDLATRYGRIPALHGVTFSVEAGTCLGILGHNGMGKTTLLKTVMGHLPVTGGSIRLAEEDVTRMPAHRRAQRGLSAVAQGREIFGSLTVEENLRMGLLRLGCARERDAQLTRILDEFPRLKALLARRGGVLSGGEQQILAIARALSGDPRVLMLDEPTDGIQPSIIDEIVDILKSLRASRGLTIVLVEQKLDFIAALADRVMVIQRGAMVGEIPPNRLRDPTAMRDYVGLGAA